MQRNNSKAVEQEENRVKIVRELPERVRDGDFAKDREIHDESDVWSTAQR